MYQWEHDPINCHCNLANCHAYFKPVLKVDFKAFPCGFIVHYLVARQPVRKRDSTTILLDSN